MVKSMEGYGIKPSALTPINNLESKRSIRPLFSLFLSLMCQHPHQHPVKLYNLSCRKSTRKQEGLYENKVPIWCCFTADFISVRRLCESTAAEQGLRNCYATQGTPAYFQTSQRIVSQHFSRWCGRQTFQKFVVTKIILTQRITGILHCTKTNWRSYWAIAVDIF